MAQNESTFKAYRVTEEDGLYVGTIKDMRFSSLEENELLVKVYYSSLNYKDALSATGNKGVTRSYPHTPGIDAVGVITESKSKLFNVGEKVIVTSYDLGMNTDGGFAEYIKVPAAWALRLPENMTMKEAMIYGTAGLTAGMSVMRLTENIRPEDGKVAVSGATGGVGAIAVSILSKLGYTVVAITGKASEVVFLKDLGADEIMLRADIENLDKKPLLKPLYAGAIDSVGGVILENIIKSTSAMGAITCCGNVASPQLEMTVFPFILRGVSLIGIDSQNFPMNERKDVWEMLAEKWKPAQLAETCREITFDTLPESINQILKGKLKGRMLLKVAV